MHGYYKIEEGTAFSIRHQRNIPFEIQYYFKFVSSIAGEHSKKQKS
jgi:hypothetical protein